MDSNIQVFIKGQNIAYSQVLEWERRRIQRVVKKLNTHLTGQDLAACRQQLLEHKMQLGNHKIIQWLQSELLISDVFSSATARLSLGRRRFSTVELLVKQGSAEQFVAWFSHCTQHNDERAMLAASPDHYVIRTHENAAQEVIETTGGSPLVTRFYIDYDDLSSLRSTVDSTYPLQIAGVARNRNGLALGGVRHQFRNEGTGFRARLTVEFPLLILPQVLDGHQWHLASEFSNWINAAFGWA